MMYVHLLLIVCLITTSCMFAALDPHATIQSESSECPICLVSDAQEVITLSCHTRHIFHRACLSSWIESTQKPATCPLCQKTVCLHDLFKLRTSFVFRQQIRQFKQLYHKISNAIAFEVATETRIRLFCATTILCLLSVLILENKDYFIPKMAAIAAMCLLYLKLTNPLFANRLPPEWEDPDFVR